MKSMENKFQGKPLIELPKEIPSAGFLVGDFGKEFLKEYNGKAKADYSNNSNLQVLNYDDKIVKGSNDFAVVLANQILRQEGLRTATQADLEKILKINALDLRGTYKDSGLVLRSEDGANKYLAQNLAKQLRARNKKTRFPVAINLADLELVNDKDSNYGLAFKLTERANPIYAPILNKPGNFNSEDIDEKTGLPKQTKGGNRILYTRKDGLSGLCLLRDLNLGSNGGDLASSDSGGRVVAVSAEGASQNLEKYVKKLNQEKARQIAEIEGKYDSALRILTSK